MYKTAFKSNPNNAMMMTSSVVSNSSGQGTVTPLPEANARTNTALGYKQSQPPKTNTMMLPSPNGAGAPTGNIVSILATSNNVTHPAAALAVQSRHSDRRDSN